MDIETLKQIEHNRPWPEALETEDIHQSQKTYYELTLLRDALQDNQSLIVTLAIGSACFQVAQDLFQDSTDPNLAVFNLLVAISCFTYVIASTAFCRGILSYNKFRLEDEYQHSMLIDPAIETLEVNSYSRFLKIYFHGIQETSTEEVLDSNSIMRLKSVSTSTETNSLRDLLNENSKELEM